jgi:hypothetical protein
VRPGLDPRSRLSMYSLQCCDKRFHLTNCRAATCVVGSAHSWRHVGIETYAGSLSLVQALGKAKLHGMSTALDFDDSRPALLILFHFACRGCAATRMHSARRKAASAGPMPRIPICFDNRATIERVVNRNDLTLPPGRCSRRAFTTHHPTMTPVHIAAPSRKDDATRPPCANGTGSNWWLSSCVNFSL